MRRLAPLLVLAFALAACGHVDRHEVVFRTAPPAGHPADVYMEGQTVETPVDDLALLQVMSYGNSSGTEATVAKLQARATALGCDAVVRVRIVNGSSGTHGFGICARRAAKAE